MFARGGFSFHPARFSAYPANLPNPIIPTLARPPLTPIIPAHTRYPGVGDVPVFLSDQFPALLSLLFPLHTKFLSATPLFPLLTQKQGGYTPTKMSARRHFLSLFSQSSHSALLLFNHLRTLSFFVSNLSPTLPISSALLSQKQGVHPLWSNQSLRSFTSSTSFTSFSSIHRPFTILLPHLHPSFSLSCHNHPRSGDQLLHHAYRYPNAYGTLLPMRSAPRDSFMKRVLIIEDDRDIVELVRYNLANEGFQVNAAFDGSSGLSTLKKTPPDLLLLDLMLPKMSGLDICREIRKDESLNRLPVLMLTARGDEADRVVGLEMGADDYVTKPFSPRELIARVKALLRRAEPPVDSPRVIEIGRLAIDPASYRVSHSGKPVPLSTLEFRLLYYLASRPNRVFTRDQLLDAVWGTDRFVTPRSVDVYVRRLREKIESDPENPLHLKTVRGAGYLFETRAA
jgi:phosphate regulon transcriptional regulator PhoB